MYRYIMAQPNQLFITCVTFTGSVLILSSHVLPIVAFYMIGAMLYFSYHYAQSDQGKAQQADNDCGDVVESKGLTWTASHSRLVQSLLIGGGTILVSLLIVPSISMPVIAALFYASAMVAHACSHNQNPTDQDKALIDAPQ